MQQAGCPAESWLKMTIMHAIQLHQTLDLSVFADVINLTEMQGYGDR